MLKKLIFSTLLLSINSVFATNVTNTTKVTASLANSCQFTTSDVLFGDYNPNHTAALTTTQTNTILCTKGTTFTFRTESQYNGVSHYANFRGQWVASMTYQNVQLYYQVKMPNGIWQDDLYDGSSPNMGHYVSIGTGQKEVYPLQYRILENQYVPPGNYSGYSTAVIEF